jgi:hypothetical protein
MMNAGWWIFWLHGASIAFDSAVSIADIGMYVWFSFSLLWEGVTCRRLSASVSRVMLEILGLQLNFPVENTAHVVYVYLRTLYINWNGS